MKIKDLRIRVVTETLGSMRVIKMQSWEKYFEDRIKELREKELKLRFK